MSRWPTNDVFRNVQLMIALDVGATGYGVGLYLILLVVPGAITWLKGQRLIFVVGLLIAGVIWMVACFRLARPDSWWACRFYASGKMDRARRRYGPETSVNTTGSLQ